MERDEHFLLLDDLEIHFLELCKYNLSKDIAGMAGTELWLTFFKEAGKGNTEILKAISERSEKIKMAINSLEKISADEHQIIPSLSLNGFCP